MVQDSHTNTEEEQSVSVSNYQSYNTTDIMHTPNL